MTMFIIKEPTWINTGSKSIPNICRRSGRFIRKASLSEPDLTSWSLAIAGRSSFSNFKTPCTCKRSKAVNIHVFRSNMKTDGRFFSPPTKNSLKSRVNSWKYLHSIITQWKMHSTVPETVGQHEILTKYIYI